MSTAFEVLPKLSVVVDLAIQYDRHGPVLVGDGLVSRYKVDYAQALDSQADARSCMGTSRVRSSVLDCFAHVMKKSFAYRFPSGASLACDAAHGPPH